jgi:mannose-6-phosphate isomerase class I
LPILIESTPSYRLYDVIGYGDSDFFSLKKLELDGEFSLDLNGVYCGIYVLSGNGEITTEQSSTEVGSAQQFFVPANVGTLKIRSKEKMTVLISNGPRI